MKYKHNSSLKFIIIYLAPKVIILIILLSPVYCFAVDYTAEAQSIADSIDFESSFTQENVDNTPGYKGTDVDQSNYYDNYNSMEGDSVTKSEDDESANLANDVFYKSPSFEVSSDEEWLQNAKQVEADPSSFVSIISSTDNSCSDISNVNAVNTCNIYSQITSQKCTASRIIDVESYHQYQCFKDKKPYERNCASTLNLTCGEAYYTLPPITYNSLNGYSYSNYRIYFNSAGRRGQNCNGYWYQLSFDVDDVASFEELKIESINVDDVVEFYLNSQQPIYKFPNTSACEIGLSTTYPNFDLKPYLITGNNTLKIRYIVGGSGILWGNLIFKYKKCKSYSSNEWVETCDDIGLEEDSCIETQKICNSSYESRDIGQSVSETHDCWDYGITKECQPTELINYCDHLANKTSCSQFGSECLETNDKECINYQNSYKCSDNSITISDKVIYEGYKQDIESEKVDYSNCNSFNSSKYCTFNSETCLDDPSPSTQNIEGLDVIRDCWNYERNYSCLSEDETNSDCEDLENNASCSYSSQTCLAYDSALCIINQKSYNCSQSSADIQLCAAPVSCSGENCDTISYTQDVNFGRAAASLSALESAALEINQDDLTTFSGNTNRCSKDLVNYSDCCDMSGWGEDLSGTLDDVTETMSPTGQTILLPALSTDLASQTISGGAQCDAEENQLALKRQARQCVYIGTFCSEEMDLGFDEVCIKEKESYCCFSSKLVRIIHEQGRPQLGISWGSPESPNCSGLSIDDLDNIDFSEIDFSEIAAEAQSNVNGNIASNADIATQVEDAINSYYGGSQ